MNKAKRVKRKKSLESFPLGGIGVFIPDLGSIVEGDHGVSSCTRVRPTTSIPTRKQCVRLRLCCLTAP